MCVYAPNLTLFQKFLDSLDKQTYSSWHCIIYVDGLSDFSTINFDSRFTIVYRHQRLGVYENFARSILENLNKYDYLFLADQDDTWHSDKIEKHLNTHFSDSKLSLVYSDARVVSQQGEIIAISLQDYERRKFAKDWKDLIIQNSISGTTVSINSNKFRGVLEFPKTIGWHHDLWLSLAATAVGEIFFIDEPLVDYVQHSGNLVGARKALPFKFPSLRSSYHAYWLKYNLFNQYQNIYGKDKLSNVSFRSVYLHAFCRGSIKSAQVELIMGSVLHTRILKTVYTSKHLMRIREVYGLIKILGSAFTNRKTRMLLRQSVSSLKQQINLASSLTTNPREEISPLVREVRNSNDSRYLLLLPMLQAPVFGGTATALKLACKLAENGQKVAIATLNRKVNLPIESIRELAEQLSVDYQTLLKLVSGAESFKISANNSDVVISTAWWTCEEILSFQKTHHLLGLRLLYFVQDYEALFYPSSEEYARVLATYDSPNNSFIINSSPLADFLELWYPHKVDRNFVLQPQQLFSQNLSVKPKVLNDLGAIRIVIYGRPNTPRNLFTLIIKGISIFLSDYADDRAIEFLSVGEPHENILFESGHELRSLGALSYSEYEELLESAHLGISLMLSPHPSYPPLEMQGKGLHTITNDFLGFKKKYLTGNLIHLIEPESETLALMLNQLICAPESTTHDNNVALEMGLSLEKITSNIIQQFPLSE